MDVTTLERIETLAYQHVPMNRIAHAVGVSYRDVVWVLYGEDEEVLTAND